MNLSELPAITSSDYAEVTKRSSISIRIIILTPYHAAVKTSSQIPHAANPIARPIVARIPSVPKICELET